MITHAMTRKDNQVKQKNKTPAGGGGGGVSSEQPPLDLHYIWQDKNSKGMRLLLL